ncbi:hypothetical protein HK101_004450 [Irineochytrium annulatum]|nr:hypothetical protein HK101_004450 [Irineochytrium annulatum]
MNTPDSTSTLADAPSSSSSQQQQQQALDPESQRQRSRQLRTMRLAVFKMIMFNLVLPSVIFGIASNWLSQVVSLTLSAIPPVIEAAGFVIRSRKLDLLSSIVIVSIVLAIVLAFSTSDARLLLVKDSFLTFILGLVFLFSIKFGKENFIWHYNRIFVGTSPEAQEKLTRDYQHPYVRRTTNCMCLVWGLGLFGEAIFRVVLIYLLPVSVMAYLSPVIVCTCFAILGVWNWRYTVHTYKVYEKIQQEEEEERLKNGGAAEGGATGVAPMVPPKN